MDSFIERDLSETEDREGVTHWASFISTTPPRFTLGYNPNAPRPRFSETMLIATNAEVVPAIMKRLEHYVTERYPDVRPYVRALGNGPPVAKPIEVRISGKDVDRAFEIADTVKQWLNDRDDTRNVGDNWGPRVKKMVIDVSEDRARRAGITNEDVATSLQTFLSGYETTQYREDDKTIPIVLRSVAEGRRNIDRLATLSVFSKDGSSVPLTQVAAGHLQWESSEILRRDRYATITVDSDVIKGVTAFDVIAELEPWLEEQKKEWGIGYRYEFGGEVEGSGKANASIEDKLPIAGMVILMLLVWQFNSLRKPAIVLATILFALVGVGIGLVVMRSYFGFMTLLGIVSLAGIVINNGIVLIDRIDIEKNRKRPQPPPRRHPSRPTKIPPHHPDHRHHNRQLDPPLLGRRSHVATIGGRHHVRPSLLHNAHPRLRPPDVLPLLPSPLQRLRLSEQSKLVGAPGGTRTPDHRLRRPLLYPAELQARFAGV